MSDAGEEGEIVAAEGEVVAKAYVVDAEADIQASNATSAAEDDNKIFEQFGVIAPPYDPRAMCVMHERSASLRPNVDVYKTNIEGFGHKFEPTINLESDPEEVDARVRDAILLEKLFDGDPTPDVPKAEVEATKLTLALQIRSERLMLEQFFETVAGDISFIELRKRVRADLELTGNAYVEVLRTKRGDIGQLVHVPSVSMRLLAAERTFHEVDERRKIGALNYRTVKSKRRLRRFVQVLYGQFIAYFKELDDPRVVSARTGRYYASLNVLQRKEGLNARPATEVLHLKIYAPTSAYGIPRWVGASIAILGSRASEEVNEAYFDNKAVPPMAVLISGGALTAGAADKIKTYIADNVKGRANFHRILVLEAQGSGGAISGAGAPRVRIEIKNLQDSQHQDALFQEYDRANTEKVGAQFRLPKILRGDMADFNRATADAALDYAEQQIFAPERMAFDDAVNRRLMPLLNARFHKFVSLGPTTKDGPSVVQMIKDLIASAVITPNEARPVASEAIGRPLPPRSEPWADVPPIVAATLAAGQQANVGAPAEKSEDIATTVERLAQLRMRLAGYEIDAQAKQLEAARKAEAEEVIQVPDEVFESWIDRSAPPGSGATPAG